MDENATNYQEWIEKIHKAAGVAEQSAVKEIIQKEKVQEISLKSTKGAAMFFLLFGIFLLAFIPRFIYLFYFTDAQNVGINWYGDVYHHWQIAYLSKEIGFHTSFLRLWDFKGLEFYWGLLHPLLLVILFTLTGSISIVILRMVSIVFGSLCIVLIFLLVRRYFNTWSAWGAAIFSTFLPVTLFSETLGMQEPLGLFFLLLGMYVLPRYAFLTGIFWMLAGMERSEFWIFGAALVFFSLFTLKINEKVQLLLGYSILCFLYMKYLLNYTNNPIYPIWIGYLATYKGDWFIPKPLNAYQLELQLIFRITFFAVAVILLLIIWKKPKGYLLYLLGFGNIAFFVLEHGFGARLIGWVDNMWVDRLLSFPYEFLGVVLSIILLYYIPKIFSPLRFIGILILICLLLVIQQTWNDVEYWHHIAMINSWDHEVAIAQSVAPKWDGKGMIVVPSGRPALTYTLAYFGKIPGRYMLSDMYNPLFYYQGGDPFLDWGKERKQIIKWLKQNNIHYIISISGAGSTSADQFSKMISLELKDKVFIPIDSSIYHTLYLVNEEKLNEE